MTSELGYGAGPPGAYTPDALDREPAALELDAVDDRRPGRGRRALGLGEPADVGDRGLERVALGGREGVGGGAQLVAGQEQAAVGPPAAEARRGLADGDGAALADVGEDRAGRLADGRVGDGAAAEQGVALAGGRRVGRAQVEAPQAEATGVAGRASREDLLDRQDEDPRRARAP